MKIEFLKARFKNILSVGNFWQEIDYTKCKYTMVTGKNGSGKSAIILDIITYALFGRPNREIKVGQLVNSITGKDCVVELTFRIGTDIYKIVRGQKPSIFEVWKNDKLINEEASVTDYQKTLENHILHMNLKTFKQVVIIGSATYKPLMQLDAKERREVTEDILATTIYSSMNEIAKAREKTLKNEVKSIDTEIGFRKEQEKTQKDLIKTMEAEKKAREKQADEKIAEAREEIEAERKEIDQCDMQIAELQGRVDGIEIPTASSVLRTKINELRDGKNKLSKSLGKHEATIEVEEEQIEFYAQENCPTCNQPITEDHRHSMNEKSEAAIKEAKDKLGETNKMLKQIDAKIKKQQESVEAVEALEHEVADLKRGIKEIQTERKQHERNIAIQERTIEEWSEKIDSSALKEAKKEYKDNYEKLLTLTESKAEKQEELQYFQMAVIMLKDDGAKAIQLNETLPQINEKINKYLKKFDMFVQFELTNTFEEVIKARHRDTFSYNSFSEGQKRRIDHSILFAFREIAMEKGSISCNIVAFDEILEKNLDEEGYETLKELIAMIDDGVNVFVITPQTVIPEFFDRTLTISYPNEFTKITEEMK